MSKNKLITKVINDTWFEIWTGGVKNKTGEVTIDGRDYSLEYILEFAKWIKVGGV